MVMRFPSAFIATISGMVVFARGVLPPSPWVMSASVQARIETGPGVYRHPTRKAAPNSKAVPTLHRESGYRFLIHASDRGEPPHVHARAGRGEAKIWLGPVRVAKAQHYTRREIGEIVAITKLRQDEFLAAWYRFFR